MSAQRLSDKNTRKWAARLYLPIIRMWSHGGYTFDFVTEAHRHGFVDIKTDEVEWDGDDSIHYSSCDEMFPGWKPGPVT